MNSRDAKTKLEAEGLHVSCNNSNSLWIAANLKDVGGIRMSNDACSLVEKSGRWVAVFPADGLLIYQYPGKLADLVSLILSVYQKYRESGAEFNQAFKQVVNDADQYLVGRPPARV